MLDVYKDSPSSCSMVYSNKQANALIILALTTVQSCLIFFSCGRCCLIIYHV